MRVSNFAAAAALLVFLLAIAPAHADWSGKGEAGLVIATGNTETKTENAKLQLANEVGKWKHQFGGAALYASSDDEGTTANRWEAFEQSDYNFSPRTFWFGAARYEDDEFSGFEYQATLSTGLGRKFIDTDVTKFVGTAGVGYKKVYADYQRIVGVAKSRKIAIHIHDRSKIFEHGFDACLIGHREPDLVLLS